MKILVYGAGNIGSLYAAKLKDAGNDVSILARGLRLQEIRERGIVLEDFHTSEKNTTRVNAVERLDTEDAYDLVLVVLPSRSVHEVLPILGANRDTPSVMFFGNNAAGAGAMTEALGQKRVLLGFPGAAGVHAHEAIRYLILARREQPTTIGELDGSESTRSMAIADVLRSAGFPVSICSNMDAWLKTHTAEIVPTAAAFCMAECDIDQLKSTRKTIVTMVRAIQEGHRVLAKLGIPITPARHRIFHWIPTFLSVLVIRRKLDDGAWSSKIGHAAAAREEMRALADQLNHLVEQSGVNTPALDRLRPYLGDRNQQGAQGASETLTESARQILRDVE